MAYEKHTWECGDTITAELLNHMEDGIASEGGGAEIKILYFTESDNSLILRDYDTREPLTFAQVFEMLDQGTIVLVAASVGYELGALSPIGWYDEYTIKFGDVFTFDSYANQLIVLSSVRMDELGNITYHKFISPTYTQPN